MDQSPTRERPHADPAHTISDLDGLRADRSGNNLIDSLTNIAANMDPGAMRELLEADYEATLAAERSD